MHERPWEEFCAQKRKEIGAKIPPEWVLEPSIIHQAKSMRRTSGPFIENLLNQSTRDLTAKTSIELIEDLRRGSNTAYEVTSAFCRRAAVAHQIVSSML